MPNAIQTARLLRCADIAQNVKPHHLDLNFKLLAVIENTLGAWRILQNVHDVVSVGHPKVRRQRCLNAMAELRENYSLDTSGDHWQQWVEQYA